MEANETITFKEFLEQLRVLAEAAWKVDPGDNFYLYVHPSVMKHHPKVRYLMRYDRRGQRMERKRRGKKR